MALDEGVRYPRKTIRVDIDQASLCVMLERLTQWQENGNILFVLMEGQGLSAQMSGGYHGNFDDDDVDMRVFSGLPNTSREKHYTWCSDKNIDLGSFGFHVVNAPNMSSHSSAHKEQFTGKSLSCIGRWESFDVLLPHPNAHYFRKLHGGSYWVPPVAGGKEMGQRFEEYMKPDQSLFPWFTWLETFHDGLRQIDQDANEEISSRSFLTMLSPLHVNQKWLSKARKKQPCFVANAIYTISI